MFMAHVTYRLIAKFHYTDTDTNPTRTRPDPHEPNGVSPQKSPFGSVRVRSGPCGVRVVEFSYYYQEPGSAPEPYARQSSMVYVFSDLKSS